jgi:hypothetical protein
MNVHAKLEHAMIAAATKFAPRYLKNTKKDCIIVSFETRFFSKESCFLETLYFGGVR